MKKFSKKGMLLIAGAMTVCAFAMPSMASAASWAGTATHDTLTSNSIGFTLDGGFVVSACNSSTFTVNRDNAQVLTITTSTFTGCTTTGGVGDCATTWQGTRSPWRATAVTTENIQIHDVVINITFTGPACAVPHSFTLTGTLGGGSWGGNAVGQRRVSFQHDGGLTAHSGSALPVFITGFYAGSTTQVLM